MVKIDIIYDKSTAAAETGFINVTKQETMFRKSFCNLLIFSVINIVNLQSTTLDSCFVDTNLTSLLQNSKINKNVHKTARNQ